MMRLGCILKKARGKESRVQFARKLELSYTFVRAMEHGLRYPSDKVLEKIADKLGESPDQLLLAAYCDRSPRLAEVLCEQGVSIPAGEAVHKPQRDDVPVVATLTPVQPAQITRVIRAHDPF